MMGIFRKSIGTGVLALALACVTIFGAPTTVRAAEGIDMNLACQYTAGYTSYKGSLLYPSQGAFGWRCVDRAGIRATMSANLWGYCVNVLGYSGAYTNNTSDPYSWYCA